MPRVTKWQAGLYLCHLASAKKTVGTSIDGTMGANAQQTIQ